MKHYLLRIIIVSFWLIALPTLSKANTTSPTDEATTPIALNIESAEAANFTLTVLKNAIQVHATACQGQVMKVYDIVGKLKCEVSIDSNDKTFRVSLSKGIYLVNIGQITRRVSIAG